jgi:exopolyphosphatase/guanosine-5'-triphosphate,3'-diphosphate pyrophosphatase
MKRASIDIGSNTVLLLIADVKEKSYDELENESRVTGLGRNLDKTNAFLPVAIEESFQALKEYTELLDKHGIKREDVLVTATEASRVASNSSELFDRVSSELGLVTRTINGQGDAFYTSFGVVKGSSVKDRLITIMDIGGASTEFIKVQVEPFEVISSISLPFGSVRATDWHNDGVFEQNMFEILSSSKISDYKSSHLLCVAGSMTSLGGMIKGLNTFDAEAVNGTSIGFNQFLGFVEKLKGISHEVLEQKFPFLGKRSQTIVGGAMIGQIIGQTLGVKTFEISTLGLRYGTLLSGEINERFCE